MERDKVIIKTSIKGIVVNILLVALKAILGFMAGSIAMILDSLNNFTDALSSIVTIIGTKLSTKAPDKEHPYGHGRFEYFSSLVVAMIILYAGVIAIQESVGKIIAPTEVNYTMYTIIGIIVSIVVKILFGKYVKGIGNKIDSEGLKNSGLDAIYDSFLSTGTLISAISIMRFGLNIEGYVGVIIGIFIVKSSIEMIKSSVRILIGNRIDSTLSTEIREAVSSYEGVEGAYDLLLHNYGPNKLIGSIHIQVKDDCNALEIDKLTRTISKDIYNKYGIILTIGIYASNDSNVKYKEIKHELYEIVNDFKEILQIHGFYVDEEKKEISFDLIFDFESKSIEEIKKKVIERIKSKYPDYEYNIVLDTDYSD